MIRLRRYNKERDGEIFPSFDGLYVAYNHDYKPVKVIAMGLRGGGGDMIITIKDDMEDVTQRRNGVDFEFYIKDENIRFNENDILTCGYGGKRWLKWVLCLKEIDREKIRYKMSIGLEGNNGLVDELRSNDFSNAQEWVRAANEKEIEVLKKAALESTDEEILSLARKLWMQPKFKPFDKVLMRDDDITEWRPFFFSNYMDDEDYPYKSIGESSYSQCIPYEGNEDLCGTINKPKEK